jgi:hypothetical protein
MNDWDLIKKIASVQNDQDKLSELILETDFTNCTHAGGLALCAFEVSPANVKKHREAAEKLKELNHRCLSYCDSFRQRFLIDNWEVLANDL